MNLVKTALAVAFCCLALAAFSQKSPGKISVGLYALPNSHYFTFEQPEFKNGVNLGLVFGYRIKNRLTIQTGLEYHSISRSLTQFFINGTDVFHYKNNFYEIPIEGRFRLMKEDKKTNFYILAGAGLVLAKTVSSTDPFLIFDRGLFLHQMSVNHGVGAQIKLTSRLAVFGEGVIKLDPLTLIGESWSFINYSYMTGLKVGIIFR